MNLIQPKEIEINGKKYILSKFPAMDGREIMRRYAILEKQRMNNENSTIEGGDRDLINLVMKYVAISLPDGRPLSLTTETLIDNHVPDWMALTRLEAEIVKYNSDPLDEGRLLNS